MQRAWARLLVASAVAAAAWPSRAGGEDLVPVTLTLEDQANEIWTELPDAADDGRVTRLGRTSKPCAADALRQAKESVGRLQAGRIALRSLKLTVPLPRTLLKASRTPGTAYLADLFGIYVLSSSEDDFVARAAPWRTRATRDTADGVAALRALYVKMAQARSDQALLPVLDPGCGAGFVAWDLRAQPHEPGRLYLHMLVEGGCACQGPVKAGARPRRFRVLGRAQLEPGTRSFDQKGVEVRWRMKEPRYVVLASCRACESGKDDRPWPASQPQAGPCGEPCAPLGESVSGWRREAGRVEAEVSALKDRTAALDADLGAKRKELESAEKLRRKPRPVLDRIATLNDQVKSAQAEVTRLSGAAAEAGQHLGELRGALDDAQASGQRCQAQCQAKQETQRQAEKASEPGAAGGGTAGAAGGGLGTGTLIAGGAAVAAGATAALVLGGGEEEPALGVAGTWAGTRIINNGPLFENCTRVFDEVWNIQQTGTNLVAEAEAIGRDCGTAGCASPCQLFPFPWHMTGTVEGPVYRLVVFGGTACIFSLRLAGDMLSGNMSPCSEAPGMTQEVSLRRRR
jgi:hypothetical protein